MRAIPLVTAALLLLALLPALPGASARCLPSASDCVVFCPDDPNVDQPCHVALPPVDGSLAGGDCGPLVGVTCNDGFGFCWVYVDAQVREVCYRPL